MHGTAICHGHITGSMSNVLGRRHCMRPRPASRTSPTTKGHRHRPFQPSPSSPDGFTAPALQKTIDGAAPPHPCMCPRSASRSSAEAHSHRCGPTHPRMHPRLAFRTSGVAQVAGYAPPHPRVRPRPASCTSAEAHNHRRRPIHPRLRPWPAFRTSVVAQIAGSCCELCIPMAPFLSARVQPASVRDARQPQLPLCRSSSSTPSFVTLKNYKKTKIYPYVIFIAL
jgi:hypothetical protein